MALVQLAFFSVQLNDSMPTGTGFSLSLDDYTALNANMSDGDTIYLVADRTSSTNREIFLVTRVAAGDYQPTSRGLFDTTERVHNTEAEITCDDVPGYWNVTVQRSSALTSGRVPFVTTGGVLTDDADMTFATDTLTVAKISTAQLTDSGLTSGRIPIASTGGLLTDDADLTFATDTLTATKLVATKTVNSGVVALSDGATPALDASLGNTFTLTAAGNRTIAVPSNPTSGQRIIIAHTASGADRTLALNTGTGGFAFGTDITGLTATTSAKTDYIGCIYDSGANKWRVVAYAKGY